jgi:NAD(P)-dependent dehydrogenase (short-subunit alcohol dehydrogenase family)
LFDLKENFMAEAATKTAIVTGGAGGVARALLPMLIGDGYRVALIDVNAIGLAKMAAEHGDNVIALPCDLTDLLAVTATLEKARVAFGTLGLLINNAGVTTTGPFVDIDPASIPRDIGINLVAPLHIIHKVAPWMPVLWLWPVIDIRRGDRRPGRAWRHDCRERSLSGS